MSYQTLLKKESPMKNTMNSFIGRISTPETKALVIDAETLMSSTSLVTYGVSPINVVVINDDDTIIRKAHNNGHKRSISGYSTEVLEQFTDTFDIIYLDYCGTPDGNKSTGVLPKYDLLWAADRISEEGVLIVTFSRRNHEGFAVEKAQNMIPLSMELVNTLFYYETCPMFAMVLVKRNFKHSRYLRDLLNSLIMEKKRKREEIPCLPVKKQKTNKSTLEKYTMIAYQHDDTMWYGVVEQFTQNKGHIKVLWLDPRSPMDYGSNKGWYPVGDYVSVETRTKKENGQWCYIQDFEKLKKIPKVLGMKSFRKFKRWVLQNKDSLTDITSYFN